MNLKNRIVDNHPPRERFKLYVNEVDLQMGVHQQARKILPWCRHILETTGKPVVAACVLRGAVPYFSDLVRRIDCNLELAYVKASSYVKGPVRSSQVLTELGDKDFSGRHILLVDDICDTGNTLSALTEAFHYRGASSLRTAVCLHRAPKPGEEVIQVTTYPLITVDGDEWFVGYGLDDNSEYANLPDIYTIIK